MKPIKIHKLSNTSSAEYTEGYIRTLLVFTRGETLNQCPYLQGTDQANDWISGCLEATHDIVEKGLVSLSEYKD